MNNYNSNNNNEIESEQDAPVETARSAREKKETVTKMMRIRETECCSMKQGARQGVWKLEVNTE